MKRLAALAALSALSLLLALAFFVGVSVGITMASAPRPAQVIPAASASRSESDPGRTGAPPDPVVAQPAEQDVQGSPLVKVAGSNPVHGANGGAPPSPAAEHEQPSASAVSVSGLTATWYCNADPARGPLSRCTKGYPDGPGLDLYAAVSPDLAHLRGATIEVCARRCVTVEVIDCTCEAVAAIDLYADAFAAIAPPGLGRVTVVR